MLLQKIANMNITNCIVILYGVIVLINYDHISIIFGTLFTI